MASMTLEDWQRIHHFKPEEFSKPFLLEKDLIFKLDIMRELAKVSFVVTSDYGKEGHVKDSLHPYGKAIDGYFKGMDLLDQFIIASRFFTGIGVYPFWTHPGLHVDIRSILNITSPEARWWRDKNGKYFPLTKEAFK